jgi:hypothetical protein
MRLLPLSIAILCASVGLFLPGCVVKNETITVELDRVHEIKRGASEASVVKLLGPAFTRQPHKAKGYSRLIYQASDASCHVTLVFEDGGLKGAQRREGSSPVGSPVGELLETGSDATEGGTTAKPTTPASPTPAGGSSLEDVAARLCREATCTGPLATIQVFRNTGGEPALLYFNGDLTKCSHPPGIYIAPDGTERERVPNRPVMANETDGVEKMHERHTSGLLRAETINCRRPPGKAP